MKLQIPTSGRGPGKQCLPQTPTRAVRPADLKSFDGVSGLVTALPESELPWEVLDRELRAGNQAYSPIVFGTDVLWGQRMVAAARDIGREFVDIVDCTDCDGLHREDHLLVAAKFHVQAAVKRVSPDEFDTRMIRASA